MRAHDTSANCPLQRTSLGVLLSVSLQLLLLLTASFDMPTVSKTAQLNTAKRCRVIIRDVFHLLTSLSLDNRGQLLREQHDGIWQAMDRAQQEFHNTRVIPLWAELHKYGPVEQVNQHMPFLATLPREELGILEQEMKEALTFARECRDAMPTEATLHAAQHFVDMSRPLTFHSSGEGCPDAPFRRTIGLSRRSRTCWYVYRSLRELVRHLHMLPSGPPSPRATRRHGCAQGRGAALSRAAPRQ